MKRRVNPVVVLAIVLVAGAGLGGCRQDMHDQPVVEEYEYSPVFAHGVGSRMFPEGTIARGQLRADTAFFTGLTADGQPLAEIPLAIDRALLERGRSRYDIFCAPCHDRTGQGRGTIVRRGFKQPASFHEERLRQQPVGYYFNVMSNGFGDMSSYAAQVTPEDRWAIAAYLRVLQWSRQVPLADLPEPYQAQAQAALNTSASPVTETASGEH